MTWTHIHCHFPESEEEANAYLAERQARQAERVAEREQVITTTKRNDGVWIATLVGDWRQGHGSTEERAIGDLWLMYAHEIIQKCKERNA
jgi:hypothetical protein